MPDIFRIGYNVSMKSGENDTAEVMLYGEIVEDGPKWWKWSEEDKSAAEFDKAIKDIMAGGAKKLLLRINSPGGVCTEAVAMRSVIANAGFDEITIRIEGLCASAATDIATLPDAKVIISEGSEYMIHNPWCIACGNANEMEHTISRLRNIEQMTRGFYMKKTGQTEEQIRKWMDEETWFTAEQAVEYGFADELLSSEKTNEMPVAACVTNREMTTMRGIYSRVPKDIREVPCKENVRNDALVAGASTEYTNKQNEEDRTMDITLEQLRAENPELIEQIQNSAVTAERTRIDEIDALTIPGYEEMAATAKSNGTSAMDFQKQIVAEMRKKGNDFMSQRQEETKPAQNVSGGAPAAKTEDEEICNIAKDIASYASDFGTTGTNGMF